MNRLAIAAMTALALALSCAAMSAVAQDVSAAGSDQAATANWPMTAPVPADWQAEVNQSAPQAAPSAGGGTVHVRGYTRKDGTYVHSHSRRK